ncbi:MAG: redox-sensing transcriptional repressor Rex [Alphaproteobacteria bacterium]
MVAVFDKTIGIPTIRRLPAYLRLAKDLQQKNEKTVSATYFAEILDIDSIVVRKDIASTGSLGKPRIGFDIEELIDNIENFLGWNNTTDAFLVGVGNLGSAILGYQGFTGNGLNIVAGFDVDPQKIGTKIYGKEIFPIDKLYDLVPRMNINMAILAVPSKAAQDVVDKLVDAGIRAIWNFTPVKLKTPDTIVTQKEDLSSGLAELSVKLSKVLHHK